VGSAEEAWDAYAGPGAGSGRLRPGQMHCTRGSGAVTSILPLTVRNAGPVVKHSRDPRRLAPSARTDRAARDREIRGRAEEVSGPAAGRGAVEG